MKIYRFALLGCCLLAIASWSFADQARAPIAEPDEEIDAPRMSDECLFSNTETGERRVESECTMRMDDAQVKLWYEANPELKQDEVQQRHAHIQAGLSDCCEGMYDWCTAPSWGGCGVACRDTGPNSCWARCLFCG
ncbi:MAG: hypothetical protein GY716_07555 [bacterium]|nr:hypothetical protein [bacterium]